MHPVEPAEHGRRATDVPYQRTDDVERPRVVALTEAQDRFYAQAPSVGRSG